MGSSKTHRGQAMVAMQHNKRMARTLGCLVASMTIGAALLDWVQPKPAHSTASIAGTELVGLVRQGALAPGTWRSIQLDPQPNERTSSRSHFVIGLDGQAVPTALWKQQRAAGDEGTVMIAVASDNSNQVTPEQWTKADQLVRTLQNECRISREQIHCDLVAVPVVPAPAPSRHVPGAPRASKHK